MKMIKHRGVRAEALKVSGTQPPGAIWRQIDTQAQLLTAQSCRCTLPGQFYQQLLTTVEQCRAVLILPQKMQQAQLPATGGNIQLTRQPHAHTITDLQATLMHV